MIPPTLVPLAGSSLAVHDIRCRRGLLTLALRHNQAAQYDTGCGSRLQCKFLLPFSWLVNIGHSF